MLYSWLNPEYLHFEEMFYLVFVILGLIYIILKFLGKKVLFYTIATVFLILIIAIPFETIYLYITENIKYIIISISFILPLIVLCKIYEE